MLRFLLAILAVALLGSACTEVELENQGSAFSSIRVATFNVSFFRGEEGGLIQDLQTKNNPQARAVAEIIQRVRPQVLLLNEFDFDPAGKAARLFQKNYLSIGQNVSGSDRPARPIVFPQFFVAPVNTGIASGHDFNADGIIGKEGRAYGGDAFGYGIYPGQYGMVLYSFLPIARDDVRTFQRFLWKDMPGALLPEDPVTGASFYSKNELAIFRLSSKSHWDIPLILGKKRIHALVSHPTPPSFDGPEDRNGRRNHDEIRFWHDYIGAGDASYIRDDRGRKGGIDPGASFVIMGDLNADPYDGGGSLNPMAKLLGSGRINVSITPRSPGGAEQSRKQAGANLRHQGPPETDTSDFSDSAVGNLRADYVLPSADCDLTSAGVFWPRADDPLFGLVGTHPFPASDHRLVWVVVRCQVP